MNMDLVFKILGRRGYFCFKSSPSFVPLWVIGVLLMQCRNFNAVKKKIDAMLQLLKKVSLDECITKYAQ